MEKIAVCERALPGTRAFLRGARGWCPYLGTRVPPGSRVVQVPGGCVGAGRVMGAVKGVNQRLACHRSAFPFIARAGAVALTPSWCQLPSVLTVSWTMRSGRTTFWPNLHTQRRPTLSLPK